MWGVNRNARPLERGRVRMIWAAWRPVISTLVKRFSGWSPCAGRLSLINSSMSSYMGFNLKVVVIPWCDSFRRKSRSWSTKSSKRKKRRNKLSLEKSLRPKLKYQNRPLCPLTSQRRRKIKWTKVGTWARSPKVLRRSTSILKMIHRPSSTLDRITTRNCPRLIRRASTCSSSRLREASSKWNTRIPAWWRPT